MSCRKAAGVPETPTDALARARRRARTLSPEVRKVADLLAQGLDDNAVARAEGIDVRTVRRRVASLLEFLDAHTRFEAGYRFRGLD